MTHLISGIHFFEDFFAFPREVRRNDLMKSDVREDDKQYHIDIDLPAIKKENVQVELKDGYLTIHAEELRSTMKPGQGNTLDAKDSLVNSHVASMSEKTLKKKDITANLADGVLTLDINKVEPKKEIRNS